MKLLVFGMMISIIFVVIEMMISCQETEKKQLKIKKDNEKS